MNPYYQYLIMNGYSHAVGEEQLRDERTPTPTPPPPTTQEARDEPTSEPTPPPTTTTGDTQQETKSGTTINIFNPDGMTSSTTTAQDVSLDTLTGDFETGTDIGGGGGGGFGGGAMMGEDEVVDGEGQLRIRTWIPLIVIAAGIGMIVLKPFKKTK